MSIVCANEVFASNLNYATRPISYEMTAAVVAGSGAITLANKVVSSAPYKGSATLTATLPKASSGSKLIFVFGDATVAGGVNPLTFSCSTGDAFELSSNVASTAANLVTSVRSVSGNNTLKFTPTDDANNCTDQGTQVLFRCETDGLWNVRVYPIVNSAAHATTRTGVWAFSTVA